MLSFQRRAQTAPPAVSGRKHRWTRVAMCLASLRGGWTQAQAATAPDPVGQFLARAAVPIASLRRACLELGDAPFASDVPQIGRCTNLGLTALGVAGGQQWYSALAGRRWVLPGSSNVSADTVAESELVVLSADTARRAARDTLLTPVWHYRFQPKDLRSVTPEVVSVDSGGTLMAIDECVNGTGGCSQSFFLRRGSRWRAVRLSFLDSLNHRFPGAINHGYHVDLRLMRANAAVYSPDDANCCPSRVAEMRLHLRGDALELAELHVRPAS